MSMYKWSLLFMACAVVVAVVWVMMYNPNKNAVLGPVISEKISAGQVNWIPSGPSNALLDCSTVSKLCVTFESIRVNKTPNDGGDTEEWQIYFKPTEMQTLPGLVPDPGSVVSNVFAYFTGPFEIEVADNIGEGPNFEYPGRDYEVNAKFCLAGENYKFIAFAGGEEDDPIANDTIPEVYFQGKNICTTPPEERSWENNSEDQVSYKAVICKYDSDMDRYACYTFRGDYE